MSSVCEACGAAIEFVKTKNGKSMPMDTVATVCKDCNGAGCDKCDGVGSKRLTHFATCSEPDRFRRQR